MNVKAHGARPPYFDFSDRPGPRSRAMLGYGLMVFQVGEASNCLGTSQLSMNKGDIEGTEGHGVFGLKGNNPPWPTVPSMSI